MGITLRSKNFSIDIGYAGFFRLRKKIAELINDDVGLHYANMSNPPMFKNREEELIWWSNYDKRTEYLANECPKNQWKVFDFLYASDCDGEVTYGTCKQILDVIGDYDDNSIYGYAGQKDCAKMKDFKRLLEDCAESKCKLKWR